MAFKIECVIECNNHLGEGPIWDVEEECLYWVDGTGQRVEKPSIWRMNPKTGKIFVQGFEREGEATSPLSINL